MLPCWKFGARSPFSPLGPGHPLILRAVVSLLLAVCLFYSSYLLLAKFADLLDASLYQSCISESLLKDNTTRKS